MLDHRTEVRKKNMGRIELEGRVHTLETRLMRSIETMTDMSDDLDVLVETLMNVSGRLADAEKKIEELKKWQS